MLTDKRFDSIPHLLPSRARTTSGAALLGGNSMPVIEFSRHSRTPMTIAFLCKETGKTIYRKVELPSEELEAEDEAEEQS